MSDLNHRVRDQIDELSELDRPELVETWIKAYGAAPFKGARKATLIRGLAYHIQCQGLGGLKPNISRQLLKIATSGTIRANKDLTKSTIPKMKLGAQLVREWNGRTHTVHVTNKGYLLGEITYGSLSAAAKAITGTHRSGPRFFGVRG